MARSGDFNVKYSKANIEDLMRLSEDKAPEEDSGELVWGWDDPDNEEMKKGATILHKSSSG